MIFKCLNATGFPFGRVSFGSILRPDCPIGILVAAARADLSADGADVPVKGFGDTAKRTFLREPPADFLSL